MTGPWRDLATWIHRAQPPRRSLWRAMGAACFASVTSVALFVGAPYLLVFSASPAHLTSGRTLAALLIVIELLAFLRSPMRYVERLSAHDLGLHAVSAWRRWLITTIGSWPYQRWSAAATGDLLERALADTDVLQDLWLRCLVPLVATASTMLLADIVVVTLPRDPLNPVAAALGLLVCQVTGVAFVLAQLPALVASERDVRHARARRTAERLSLQESAPEIELLGRSAYVTRRLDAATAVVEQRERRRDRRHMPLQFAVAASPLLALFVVSVVGNQPADLRGRTGLVVLLLAVAVADLVAVARQSVTVAASVTAATERLDALAHTPAHGSAPWPTDALLDVESLRWRTGDHLVLDDVTMTIASGRRIAITGPSGSGKSTLLRLLARLDDAAHGAITYGGVDVGELDELTLRQHVAYVSAQPALLTGVVDHVIRVGRLPSGDVETSLAEIGIRAAPTARWEFLSRGETQRAALVRGLWGEPDVVVLDEPTSGLGALERDLVLRRLERVSGTVIIATHDEDVIAWCHEQYVIDHGRLQLVSR